MNENIWNAGEEEVYDYSNEEEMTTFIQANGSRRPVDVGANFVQVVKDMARATGFGKFRVVLNGRDVGKDIDPNTTVEEGSKIEIRPYDEAGC